MLMSMKKIILVLYSFLNFPLLSQPFSLMKPTTTRKGISSIFRAENSFILKEKCNAQRHCTTLHYSKKENQDAEFWRKMALVRNLQSTYYASPDESINSTSTSKMNIDLTTGTIQNLRVWRVGWAELPGRSNVLFINEPSYTHMFEQIMRSGPKPWYFGHLYLEGGSSSLQKARSAATTSSSAANTTANDVYRLRSWKDEMIHSSTYFDKEYVQVDVNSTSNLQSDENVSLSGEDDDDLEKANNDTSTSTTSEEIVGQKSSVIGALMRIVDCRRMKDGRILLLVQALERFAVSHVHQEYPFAIADVQLIPELEETSHVWKASQPNSMSDSHAHDYLNNEIINQAVEEQLLPVRAQTVASAFQYYHEYEFDSDVELPVKDKADISVSDVFGPYLKKVMPFIPYSSEPFSLSKMKEFNLVNSSIMPSKNLEENSESTLESQMIEGGILHDPPTHPEMHRNIHLSADALEKQLWIYIDEFVRMRYGKGSLSYRSRNQPKKRMNKGRKDKRSTNDLPINPNLLVLLPRNKEWPNHFILEDIISDLENNSELQINRVSEDYPAHKRQKRLSFIASALLERMPMGGGTVLRQILLEIPSTHARLWYVLKCTDMRVLSLIFLLIFVSRFILYSVVVERFEVMNSQLIGSTGEFM